MTRAVCKVPAPGNAAENFWRARNMVAAVDLDTGARVVRGTGKETEVNFDHPETGNPSRKESVISVTYMVIRAFRG